MHWQGHTSDLTYRAIDMSSGRQGGMGISLIAPDLSLIGISGIPYTVPPKSLTTLIPQQKTFSTAHNEILKGKTFSHPALKGRNG